MPALYEKIRDQKMAKGASKKSAQTTAAKIYNAQAKKTGKPSLAEYKAREHGKMK